MARTRLKRLFPIGLSIAAACESLQIPRRVAHRAIYETAELRAYETVGFRKRILVKDLIAWVETWPRATIARKIKRVSK